MADGISIPGVSDKYKTNDLVESLMEVERIPLKREESTLETYKKQQDAWRSVNQKMSTLRDTTKTLYSFENPFNNKLASSSDENAITVDAGREAEYGSFKIEVIQPATADRFLSADIDKDYKVKAGKYTFSVGEKTIDFNWKGGSLTDFVSAINKRSSSTIKASIIGISANKKSLLIESLKPGEENRLVFKNDALSFAEEIQMISPVKTEITKIGTTASSFKTIETKDSYKQEYMPLISKNNVKTDGTSITLGARGGFELEIPEDIRKNPGQKLEFAFSSKNITDITEALNGSSAAFEMPDAGSIDFMGIHVENNPSEASLPRTAEKPREKLVPVSVSEQSVFAIKNEDGTEIPLDSASFEKDGDKTKVSISLSQYPSAKSLIIRNSNTGKEITLSVPESYDSSKSLGFAPVHPVSTAGDAKVKYEGITMTRSTNDIDDIVPHITLHLHDKTEKPATIKIDPDKDSAKDAIITFVGKYNQVIAEMNVLSTNKPEVVNELDYLTKDEQDEYMEKLGMFQGDFTLTNGKSSLQRICSSTYRFSEDSTITLLAQIGISTNAARGNSGYSPAQMRGYLEVDEKKLDAVLEENLNEIKNLFGYDSDGDLVIDDGIAYKLDRQLTSYVQSGGIISSKTNALETSIKASNQKITRLQTQLDQKEAELKSKYATMEGTLNRLEGQSNYLNNFNNQGNNK